MKLTEKLKEQVKRADNTEDKMELLKEAGILLDDDELDFVSGGNSVQNQQLMEALGITPCGDTYLDNVEIEYALNARGLRVYISNYNENIYRSVYDYETGRSVSSYSMTHQEVLDLINNWGDRGSFRYI